MDFAAARAAMVRDQLEAGGIADSRVLAAMGEVPREEFVPERWRGSAYADGALPIGHGQTISQPWVVAAICEALELEGSERVFEVGTGSGYSAMVLARLATHVTTTELVPELAAAARTTLERLGVSNVEVIAGDGSLQPPSAPYDAIAVHAVAPQLPPALARALLPGGRLVVPIAARGADMLTAYRRVDEGGPEPRLERRAIAPCRFVPLLGEGGFASGEIV